MTRLRGHSLAAPLSEAEAWREIARRHSMRRKFDWEGLCAGVWGLSDENAISDVTREFMRVRVRFHQPDLQPGDYAADLGWDNRDARDNRVLAALLLAEEAEAEEGR